VNEQQARAELIKIIKERKPEFEWSEWIDILDQTKRIGVPYVMSLDSWRSNYAAMDEQA
jgi:hypothetical protein